MKIPIFILNLISTILIISCSNDLVTTENKSIKGRLSGIVYDAKTMEPVGRANVKMKQIDSILLTDEFGNFKTSNLDTGLNTIFLSRKGYQSISYSIRIKPDIENKSVFIMYDNSFLNVSSDKPQLIFPVNNSFVVNLQNQELIWYCKDTIPGDTLIYNLYFDVNQSNLKLEKKGIANQNYSIENLKQGTTYYWQIEAIDKYGASKRSEISAFKADSERFQVDLADDDLLIYLNLDGNLGDQGKFRLLASSYGKLNYINDKNGFTNSAVFCEENNYFGYYSTIALKNYNSFTFSIWVNPKDNQSLPVGFESPIFTFLNSNDYNSYGLYLSNSLAPLFMVYNANGVLIDSMNTNTYLSYDKWSNICVTYQNEMLKLYLDGKLAGSKNIKILNNFFIDYFFGHEFYLNGSYFTGGIDEFVMYKRVLTDKEIANLAK